MCRLYTLVVKCTAPVARKQNVTLWAVESIGHTLEILAMSPAVRQDLFPGQLRPQRHQDAAAILHRTTGRFVFVAAGVWQEGALPGTPGGPEEEHFLFYWGTKCSVRTNLTVSILSVQLHSLHTWNEMGVSGGRGLQKHSKRCKFTKQNPLGTLKGGLHDFLSTNFWRGGRRGIFSLKLF